MPVLARKISSPRNSNYEQTAAAGATFAVYNPTDGSVVAQAARGDATDADLAVQAARAAFPRWANLPASERERLRLKAADIFEQRKDRFPDLLMDESGSTIAKARDEVNFTPQLLRAAAGAAA